MAVGKFTSGEVLSPEKVTICFCGYCCIAIVPH